MAGGEAHAQESEAASSVREIAPVHCAKRTMSWIGLSRSLLCFVGLVVSGYSLFVEVKKLNDPSYQALCDISEYVSCSKAFTSR